MRRKLARTLIKMARRIDPNCCVDFTPIPRTPAVVQVVQVGQHDRRLQALVDDGTYASKGAARRALGLPEPGLPPLSPSLRRFIGGLAGSSPELPNMARPTDV